MTKIDLDEVIEPTSHTTMSIWYMQFCDILFLSMYLKNFVLSPSCKSIRALKTAIGCQVNLQVIRGI